MMEDNNSGYIPPQATEIEDAVLGAILIDQNSCIAAMKMLSPDVFYKPQNKEIYRCIENAANVDTLIIVDALNKNGKLDRVGGAAYVNGLASKVYSGMHSEHHARILLEKYVKRLYVEYSHRITRMCYEDADIFEIQISVNELFKQVDGVLSSGGGASHIREIIYKASAELDARIKQAKSGEQTGIETGIPKLNTLLLGWQKSDLIIQAARPGMGKTALALHHAHAAAASGKSVCIYSLEMSDVRLVDRLIIKQTGIDPYRYKSGNLNQDEYNLYHIKIAELEQLPIYIDDNPIVSMDYIAANSMVMQQEGRCDMVIIDYLQLAEMSKGKGKSREQEVSEASRKAKIIAKNLNVPVLLLSQLNRSVETRGGEKRPNLSDLRDSGAIEQDADIVMFIYRPEYYGILEDSEGNMTKGYGELIIAKHRNGALDTVEFGYNESMTQLSDYNAGVSKDNNTPF